MKGRLAEGMFRVGMQLVLLPFTVALLAVVGFLAGFPLADWVWLGAPLALGAAFALSPGTFRARAAELGAVVAIAAGTLWIAALSQDFSWDGLYYHQLGIQRMAAGWNPFAPLGDPRAAFGEAWWLIVNMTKFTWYYEAAVFKLTGQLELAKHLNGLLLAASFLLAASTLRRMFGLRRLKAGVLGAVIALNPVAVNQLLTFYVDGCLASVLVVLLCLEFRMARAPGWRGAFFGAAAIGIAANIKLTGLAYVAVISGGFFLSALARRRWGELRLRAAAAVLGVVLATAIGFSPFVVSWKQHADPMRPLREAMPVPSWDPYAKQRPQAMKAMPAPMRFFVSMMSASSNADHPPRFDLKLPFMVSQRELENARVHDCRVGGFGPWFGGALLVSVLLLAIRLLGRDRQTPWALAVFAVLLASVLVNPEAWWARFVPQAWLLPLVPLALRNRRVPLWSRAAGHAVLGALVLNAAVVGWMGLGWQRDMSRAMEAQIAALARRPAPPVIDFGGWPAARYRLAAAGVSFVERSSRSPASDCGDPIRVGFATLRLCEGRTVR